MATIEVIPAQFKLEITAEELRYMRAVLGLAGSAFDRHIGIAGEKLFSTIQAAVVENGLADVCTGKWELMCP